MKTCASNENINYSRLILTVITIVTINALKNCYRIGLGVITNFDALSHSLGTVYAVQYVLRTCTVATLIAPECTAVNTDAVSTVFLKPQITRFQALFREASRAITS